MATTGNKTSAGQSGDPQALAQDTAGSVGGSRIAAGVSMVALAFSAFSLWETSLKQADLAVFVPPVIQFSAPYQNSNFEMISIPVTLSNEGARTGAVLSMELAVTDPRSKASKLFYAADIGNWSMDRARSRAFTPFAPMAIAGRSSRTETVIFYTRGEDQKPNEILREPGPYAFKLSLEVAENTDYGPIDRWWRKPPPSVSFVRELKSYDARAFQNGTLPLYSADWRSATNVAND